MKTENASGAGMQITGGPAAMPLQEMKVT